MNRHGSGVNQVRIIAGQWRGRRLEFPDLPGLRPTPEGLAVSPAIPAAWDGFTLRKVFRGKVLHITVDNRAHRESGVTRMILNGKAHAPGVIRAEELLAENELTVVM